MSLTKVLVVEDEIIVAKIISSQLQQLGYTVLATASSGQKAIDKAREVQPDLVLMDIVLKGQMDGITAATQIREHLDVPIVYLTAYADEATLERAQAAHPFGYIIKPFSERDLHVTLEVALHRHQMEREVRANREQLSVLLQAMGDGVIATNRQGCITFMNPSAEALTGWQQEETLGKQVTDIFQLINELTKTPIENPVQKAIQEQKIVYLEDSTALITRDGSQIPISDSASPIFCSSGELSGAILVFGDISQRRQAEALNRALQQQLELNELKAQFVSAISHEFRTPLMIIQTATSLLDFLGSRISDIQRETYLRQIKKAIQNLDLLVEDILLVRQAEMDGLQFSPSLVNLEQFCQDIVTNFLLLEDSADRIRCVAEGNCSEVFIDERLVRYVLTNLISNALKYSPSNSTVELNLTCDWTEQVVIFRIQDQGIGIPEVEQAQVFEFFQRASNTRSIQGSGLGLAIAKQCVELHHGKIALTSAVGVGTTFTVTLPIRPPAGDLA